MIFEQHYLDCLSQASYFIGDETTKRAVVVDPRRDISPYLASAKEHGMTIELVLETHFHADFLSGHLELSKATNAPIAYGSAANPEFEARMLADGERISLGNVTIEVRHTPGHTPESVSFVIFENGSDDTPYGVLTGDTLFIGDVGRPDLLSSVGVTQDELAGHLYDSLHHKIMTLPDETRLYPGHGAGSACGKNLSSDTSCSIGEQRRSNYAVQPMTKDEFIAVVTQGQTAPPAYFSYDAGLNKAIRPLFDEAEPCTPLDITAVIAAQRSGAVVLDSRSPGIFAAGHLRGSINVGLEGRFSEFVGGIVEPGSSIVIVAEPGREAESKTRLARIGFDSVLGYLDDPEQAFATKPEAVTTTSRFDIDQFKSAADSIDDVQIVDVRQPGETADGAVPGAVLIPLTTLSADFGQLDPHKPTMLYCAGGFRSMIAASKLELEGFAIISDLLGGYGAWIEAGEPVVVPAAT